MFENIEELEREVQEFRKNILASSELVASFERMISLAKEQVRVIDEASSGLQAGIEQQTVDLQHTMADSLKKQADMIAAQSAGFSAESKRMLDAIDTQTKENAANSTANLESFERNSQILADRVDQLGTSLDQRVENCFAAQSQRIDAQTAGFAEATQKFESSLGQQMEVLSVRSKAELSANVEKLVAANQEQIRAATNAMEATNRAFSAKCDETTKSFESLYEALNARYEQVLEKLEAANVTETVRLSKSIIKSINVKFGILLIGVAASIILAALAFIK